MPYLRGIRKFQRKVRQVQNALRPKQNRTMKYKRFVQRMIAPLKQLCYTDDNVWNGSSVTTSGIISKCFTVPAVGGSINQRLGDTVYLKKMIYSIVVRGAESTTFFNTDLYNNFDVKICYVKRNNGQNIPAITGVNGIYDNTYFNANTVMDAPLGDDIMDQIKVLKVFKGKVAGLEIGTASTAPIPYVSDHVYRRSGTIYFKGKGKRCDFNSSTDATTSFNGMVPFIVAMSDSGATPNPQIYASVRCWFSA